MNRQISSQYIIDLYKNIKYYGKLKKFTIKKELQNPLCGDIVTLYILIEKDKIVDVSFESSGCMISKVASFISLDMIKGKDLGVLKKIKFEDILDNMMIKDISPSRKKCAYLTFGGLKSIGEEYK
ncbi:iron-sulfur cluster assembly scaffold protein [Patescibacteria group bacterium]|nr:iron-sulfur cluster assembly scaffold protein [Patescibacteria group bacterium]